MLTLGVIEPTTAEWASPVVFIPKKDGSLRFCVDFRRLNAVTKRDSYPLPRMDECIDSLGDATVFSTLDCNQGYWKFDVAPEDRDKTTFTFHNGLYRFKRMPFGLRNAPSTFQRAIDIILSSVRCQYALVYLDEIIVLYKSVDDHFKHLRAVLDLRATAGVTLRLPKCFFLRTFVEYLGHVIYNGKLAVASRPCTAVKGMEPPRDATQLRSFLGLCNVYRRFVPNFVRIASPLTAMLRKGEPKASTLDEEGLTAFLTLQAMLLKPPVLALPRRGAHTRWIRTHATSKWDVS